MRNFQKKLINEAIEAGRINMLIKRGMSYNAAIVQVRKKTQLYPQKHKWINVITAFFYSPGRFDIHAIWHACKEYKWTNSHGLGLNH